MQYICYFYLRQETDQPANRDSRVHQEVKPWRSVPTVVHVFGLFFPQWLSMHIRKWNNSFGQICNKKEGCNFWRASPFKYMLINFLRPIQDYMTNMILYDQYSTKLYFLNNSLWQFDYTCWQVVLNLLLTTKSVTVLCVSPKGVVNKKSKHQYKSPWKIQ